MIRRNIIANFLGQGWSGLMSLAFIPVYIEFLGVEAYGLIAVFAMLQLFMGLLDVGMSATINREMARYTAGNLGKESIGELLRTLEVACVAIAGIVVAAFWFGSPWLASHWLQSSALSEELVANSIFIMGIVLALRILEGLYRGAILGLQRQVLFNGMNAGLVTLRWLGAALVVAWWSPTIEVYFYWQTLASAVSIVALSLACYRIVGLRFGSAMPSVKALGGVWAFSGSVFVIMCFNLLLTQFDKVLLAKLISLEEFGYYSLAVTIAAIGGMLATPVGQAVFPRFVERMRDEEGVVALYHKSSQFITVLAAPAMMLLSLYAEEVLFVWTGDPGVAYKAGPILSVLSLGALFNVLLVVPYNYQLSIGWTSLSMKMSIVSAIVYVPAIFVVVSRYGAIGAACMSALLFFFMFTFSIRYMHRHVLRDEMKRWYVSDVMMPMVGAVAALLSFGVVAPDAYGSRVHGFLFLAAAGAAALGGALLLAKDVRGGVMEAGLKILRR